MRTRIGFLLALIAVLMPLGCSKQSTEPGVSLTQAPLSYVGPGEFGFSDDGTYVMSQNSVPGNVSASATISSDSLSPSGKQCEILMTCTTSAGLGYNLLLNIQDIVPGTYPVAYNHTIQPDVEFFVDPVNSSGGIPVKVGQSGAIKITKFDTINNVVSGMFQFIASVQGNSSTDVNIDSGYFNDIPITSGEFGQGTITATVNGQPFGISLAAQSSLSAQYIYVNGAPSSLLLGIDDKGSSFLEGLSLDIFSPVVLDSTYDMPSDHSFSSVEYYTVPLNNVGSQIYWSSSNGSGTLTITKYDTVARRISATFSFTAPSDSSSTIVNVTNGVINNVQWYVVYR